MLFKVDLNNGTMVSYGEVGLPPKKAGVYLSDVGDVEEFHRRFVSFLMERSSDDHIVKSCFSLDHEERKKAREDVFRTLPHHLFPSLKQNDGKESNCSALLLLFLDQFLSQHQKEERWRAPASAMDCAIMSLWCSYSCTLVSGGSFIQPESRVLCSDTE